MEPLVVVIIAVAVGWAAIYYLRQRRLIRECRDRLWNIYTALEMYEIDRGTLPRLAFFPNDPREGSDSLAVVLQPYTAMENLAICPAAPPAHRALGLTYVWNVELNGRKLHAPGVTRWMLVELNALSDSVPPPHLGRYHILYTDGQIELSRNPPQDLRRL